ncbi:hypothetical protein EC973_003331 [Apophysomyces ossiformis]|uniref:Ankyrin repeat protein n=1 Tax=Apophysomyces ossiformis TaxID=679940 RepID=A0A8H7EVJ3_9FUNG|nr:hypothetical protein EC973_003331 [Apophysomyces ossiformis]
MEKTRAKRTADVAGLDDVYEQPTARKNSLKRDPEAKIWESISLEHLDMKALYQYIRSSGEATIANAEGYGMLYLAARNQSMEALRILLLQPNIDVNALHGPHGELALHASASAGQFDAVELLIEHGSNVDIRDTLGHTPLSNSLFGKSYPATKLLIQSGASLDVEDSQGNSLIHLAVTNNFPEAIDHLLKDGAEVDRHNRRGLSPLALAISLGHMESMHCLLRGGADVNGRTRFATVLHHAVTWNRFEAVQALVERGCDINALNVMEETPLLVAVQQRKIDLVKFLLEHGALSAATNQTNINLPLMYAANHGYTEMCRLLLTEDTTPFSIRSAASMSERSGFTSTTALLRAKLTEPNSPPAPTTTAATSTPTATITEKPSSNTASPSRVLDTDFSSLIHTFSDEDDYDNNNSPATDRAGTQ